MELTDREIYLMREAFEAGHSIGYHSGPCSFAQWMDDSAGDGITVEMVLVKEAPQCPRQAAINYWCSKSRWGHPRWKKQDFIKALLDLEDPQPEVK